MMTNDFGMERHTGEAAQRIERRRLLKEVLRAHSDLTDSASVKLCADIRVLLEAEREAQR